MRSPPRPTEPLGGFDAPLNVASGRDALFSNTTGANNVATGASALFTNTTGGGNVATGESALSSNTTGFSNVATGYIALLDNTTGYWNVASGQGALENNTTGFENAATGAGALVSNTTGQRNVAIGDLALSNNITGTGNIAVGADAGSQVTAGDNNIHISNTGVFGDTAQIRVGTQGTQTAAFLAGVANSAVVGDVVTVDPATGQLGTAALSSRRFKEQIRPIGSLADRLMRLQPVSFLYKDASGSAADQLQFGLIAEDVAEVFPELVLAGPDGKPNSVAYHQMPALLLAQLQSEHKRGDRMQRGYNRMKRDNARMKRDFSRLEAQVRALARKR